MFMLRNDVRDARSFALLLDRDGRRARQMAEADALRGD